MTRLEHDWFDAPLPDNVTIGAGSWLYSSFAFVHYRSTRGVVIGAHSGVYDGSFLELGPQGYVRIGDYTTLVGVIVCSNGDVVIDDYAFLAHEVVIGDSDWGSPSSSAGSSSQIRVRSGAWVGARAVLLPGADVGEDAVVGAGAVVRGPVPDGATFAGNPGRVIGPPTG